jgi:hypothetical protein
VLRHHGDLVRWNVAAEGFALFPALEVVVGAVGTLADDAELARFHVLDLGELLKNLGWRDVIHGRSIYTYIYYSTKKRS